MVKLCMKCRHRATEHEERLVKIKRVRSYCTMVGCACEKFEDPDKLDEITAEVI